MKLDRNKKRSYHAPHLETLCTHRMKSLSRFSASFFLTFVFISTEVLASSLYVNLLETCPPKLTISPCTCHHGVTTTLLKIRCSGPTVTQKTVNRVSLALWEASKSNISDGVYLYLGDFIVQDTLLEEFDLLPFTGMRISWFEISNNPKLFNIIFSGNSSNPIRVLHLHLENNSLADAGFTPAFVALHPDELWTAHLSSNLIVGSEGAGEFLRGLSAFKGLSILNLTHNKISRVVGGQFKEIQKLRDIILDQNPLIEVGDDAFLLHHTDRDPIREFKWIHLIDCGLNESKFSGRTGIERNQNSTAIKLFLAGNDFETISEETFGPFLAANPKNELEFEKKPAHRARCWRGFKTGKKCEVYKKQSMVCDDKLKWLKKEKSYLARVGNLTCKNDPGQTIYSTKLV